MYKIFIVENGERYYLRDWFVYEDNDCLVFTANGKYAMRFKSLTLMNDYIYQLKANGYSPRTEYF